MIEDRELQALVDFQGKVPVLSLYLNTDLAHQSKDAVKLMSRQQLKEWVKLAPLETEAIEQFLEFEYDWQSRGLAVFASGRELWEVIPLPLPPAPQAYYSDRPYVRVLTDMSDRFARYAVALIDSQGLRLFTVAWGSIQAGPESAGEDIKRHRQGGWAASRLQRHEDNQTLHNLKQTIEAIQDFCQPSHIARLVLAGKPDVLAQVKELMPKPLFNQVIGEFPADMTASPAEILNRSLDLVAQVDLEEEQRLVEEAITAAAKGGAGVIGLADTLYALHRAQVHQLLVEENYHAPGYVCENCGFTGAKHLESCPFCSQDAMTDTPDVVNRAIAKAMQTGAEVNIVRQNEQLSRVGGIAAILRY